MHKYVFVMICVATMTFCMLGCGDKGTDGNNSGKTATNGSGAGMAKRTPEMEKAANIVSEFITAMLKGDEAKAFSLLSPKAQEEYKTSGENLPFSANDDATFTIDNVAPIDGGNNTAFGVAVTMTEKYSDGDYVTNSGWIVRNDNGKFSLVGLILKEEDLEIQFDFEDIAGSRAKMQQQAPPQTGSTPGSGQQAPPVQPPSSAVLPPTAQPPSVATPPAGVEAPPTFNVPPVQPVQ